MVDEPGAAVEFQPGEQPPRSAVVQVGDVAEFETLAVARPNQDLFQLRIQHHRVGRSLFQGPPAVRIPAPRRQTAGFCATPVPRTSRGSPAGCLEGENVERLAFGSRTLLTAYDHHRR